MRRLVLAVDLGSGGPKVGYLTTTGEPVWWWYERGDALDGAATQDAQAWWRTIVTAARAGIEQGGVPAHEVVGVAVTGQWASTVPVDEHGTPVGECLMWSDTRGADHSAQRFGGPVSGYAPGVLATWLRRSGGAPSPTGADPIAHMLHVLNDRPEIAWRTKWFLEPVDYLTMRFTGVPAASPMSMTAAWLTDNRDLSILGYDPVLVAKSGVDPERLPPLVRSGSVVGTVLPHVAEEIGIPQTAQVVTGAPDLHNAAIASGGVELYRPHVSLGTSAWVSCPVPRKKTDIVRQMASVPGFGDGNYLLANNQDNAGRCLEWFRAGLAAESSYDALAGLAAKAAPGAGGVIFTPWLTGERSPIDDRLARGGFHNLSLEAGLPELTRAVLEGVAFNLRWLLEAADGFTRRPLDSIRLIGGGARLDVWCQILADVCGRTFERVDDPLIAGLRGGALFAGMALGDVTADQLADLVPVGRVFAPTPAHKATYDRVFKEFTRLHRQQKSFFKRMNGVGR